MSDTPFWRLIFIGLTGFRSLSQDDQAQDHCDKRKEKQIWQVWLKLFPHFVGQNQFIVVLPDMCY